MFTLSVPLQTLPNHNFYEGTQAANYGSLTVEVIKTSNDLRIAVSGFDSVESARNFIPKLRDSLAWALFKYAAAIPRTLEIREPARPQNDIDDVQASKNVCSSFGMPFDGTPRAGILDTSSAYVVETGKKYFEITAGVVSTSIRNQVRTLSNDVLEGLDQIKNNLVDENILMALDLYQGMYLESSAKARFFSLIMSLEILSTDTPRPVCVMQLVDKWNAELKNLLLDIHITQEEKDAFEALQNTVIHQRNESIRKRIFNFVFSTLRHEGEESARLSAKRARAIYDIRSSLTHKGSVDPDEFNRALEDLKPMIERLFKAILCRTD